MKDLKAQLKSRRLHDALDIFAAGLKPAYEGANMYTVGAFILDALAKHLEEKGLDTSTIAEVDRIVGGLIELSEHPTAKQHSERMAAHRNRIDHDQDTDPQL